MRSSVILLTSLALVPLVTGCGVITSNGNRRDIVIGADIELSGADAAIGGVYQRALQMKVDQINSAGGVDGRRLRLDIHNNRSDPATTANDLAAFADRTEVVAVVTGACSECVIASAALTTQRRLPTVSLAPAAEVAVPVDQRRYLFKVGPNADDSAAVLADELSSLKVSKVALVGSDDLDGHGATQVVRAQVLKTGATVTAPRFFGADNEVSSAVTDAVATRPGALVISAFPAAATAAAAAARSAGFTGQIMFTSMAAGDLFLRGPAAEASENAVMAAPQALVIDDVVATTPAKTARKRWFTDYMSKVGQFSGYSTYAADAVQLIANAVHTAGGSRRDRIRDGIESAQFDGISGPLRFTPENHSGVMPQAVTSMVARSSRWRLLG